MYKIITYLTHLVTATDQHGVHSPFVYDYLTKCLYAKPKYRASKSENVLLKSISYFSIETFKIDSKDSQVGNRIFKEIGLRPSDESTFDLIYLDNPEESVGVIYEDKIHNDSLIFLKNIHRTKDASNIWEALRQNEMVKVSIDMFHCGILFFRKEQVKEHFKIRI